MKEQQNESRRKNERLALKLQELKTLIQEKQEEIDNLCAAEYLCTFIAHNADDTVDVDSDGRRLRVNVRPGVEASEFTCGSATSIERLL